MKKLNYKETCKDILVLLTLVELKIRIYDKFELAEPIKDEIKLIKEQLEHAIKIRKYDKTAFENLMDLSCTIEDCLSEIELVSGDLIKELNKLSEKRRKAIYSALRISPIDPEFEGISDKLYYLLSDMFKIIWEINKRYEDYYEDE